MKRPLPLLLAVAALALSGARDVGARQQAGEDGIADLLLKLQQVMQIGQPAGYGDLLSPLADRAQAAEAAVSLISPGITRAVVRERDRVPSRVPSRAQATA